MANLGEVFFCRTKMLGQNRIPFADCPSEPCMTTCRRKGDEPQHKPHFFMIFCGEIQAFYNTEPKGELAGGAAGQAWPDLHSRTTTESALAGMKPSRKTLRQPQL